MALPDINDEMKRIRNYEDLSSLIQKLEPGYLAAKDSIIAAYAGINTKDCDHPLTKTDLVVGSEYCLCCKEYIKQS